MPHQPIITIAIEAPSKERLGVLRAISRDGMSSTKAKALAARSELIGMIKDGLVRVDGLGSVHLTTCGLMCLEAINKETPTGAAA